MAMYVGLVRIAEDAAAAEYAFGGSEPFIGRLRLDKRTGRASVTRALPGDPDGAFAARAVRKIELHWAAGALPDRTCRAS